MQKKIKLLEFMIYGSHLITELCRLMWLHSYSCSKLKKKYLYIWLKTRL